MVVKIENPKYSYAGNNIVSVSGELVLYDDSDNATELYRRGISTRGNLSDATSDTDGEFLWKVNAENALVQQAQAIIAKYKAMMQIAASMWPGISTPDEALGHLVSAVEAKIVK